MEGSPSSAVQNILQEFWILLYEATLARDSRDRDVKLLRAWGVSRFAHRGPMNCEQCHIPVRLAIPVVSERFDGESLRYSCLCTNCTFEELERAERIIMQVGSTRVEYPHEGNLPH
jgi:hypothetical protein